MYSLEMAREGGRSHAPTSEVAWHGHTKQGIPHPLRTDDPVLSVLSVLSPCATWFHHLTNCSCCHVSPITSHHRWTTEAAAARPFTRRLALQPWNRVEARPVHRGIGSQHSQWSLHARIRSLSCRLSVAGEMRVVGCKITHSRDSSRPLEVSRGILAMCDKRTP